MSQSIFSGCFVVGMFFLLGLVLRTSVAYAHGSEEALNEEHAAADIQPEPPAIHAKEFAQSLQRYGGHLLNEENTMLLSRIVRLFEESASAMPVSNEETPEQAKHRTLAQHELAHLVEKISNNFVPVDDLRGLRLNPITINLPGGAGAALLRIERPGPGVQFEVSSLDLEVLSEPGAVPRLVFSSKGTTWHLLVFKRVPAGASKHHVLFVADADEKDSRLAILKISGSPVGELKVTIRDEMGEITPALVRLVHRPTNTLYQPGSFIDMASQTGNIVGLSDFGFEQPMPLRVAGQWAGFYWLADGEFSNALPDGEWEIFIHHGVEFEPIRDVFRIEEGKTTTRDYQLKRWTDMKRLGWWSGDDHVHARLMTNQDAARLMKWAVAADIHVANILTMGDWMRLWYPQRGFGKDFRYQVGDRVLVPGQEDPRFYLGHTIGLNVQKLVRDEDKYLFSDWVADEIHRQGGLYGHAHISHYRLFNGERDLAMLMPLQKSDFGAIMQCNTLEPELYYKFLNLGFRLAASAGSDTPYGSSVGEVRVYVYLGERPFDPDAWFDGLKAGKTFVTNGPMIDFSMDGVLPGGEIVSAENRTLTLKVKAWGLRGQSAPKRLMVVRNGKCIEESVSDDPERTELFLTKSVEVGYGGWFAIHVLGHDGSAAHTTPIYVVRNGFRTWSIEEAPGLIQWCKQILQEMDEDMDRHLKMVDDPATMPYDLAIASCAKEFKEKIAQVRLVYEDLEKVLAQELVARRQEP